MPIVLPHMEAIGIEALKSAIEILGSQDAAARAVGVKQPSVSYIVTKGEKVPAEWCIPLEVATRAAGRVVPRQRYRPDLYPDDDESSFASAAQ